IHDNFIGIEAMALLRFVRAMYSITVELVRPGVRQKRMPDHVSLFQQRDASGFLRRIASVEQAQLDTLRVFGEQRKVDAHAGPASTEGIGTARPDSHGCGRASSFVPASGCEGRLTTTRGRTGLEGRSPNFFS